MFPGLHARAQTSPVGATSVPFILPGGLTYDAQGDLYFADAGANVIRKVALDGTLTTFAGTGIQGFAGDGGPATGADFDSPQAIAFDGAGDLFIADTHNHRIRRVDVSSGVVTTVMAGAQVGLPTALAIDPSGNLSFADAANNRILRRDAASGAVTTVAGSGVQGYAGDGGPATAAVIDSPYGLALDAAGDLYFSDTHNHCVRRVDHTTGIITTVAGSGYPGFAGDGGAAASAALRLPRGLDVDAQGNLFVVDSANHRLRRVDAVSGTITSVAGDGTQDSAGDNGPATAASLDSPRAVALSPAGLPTLSDTHNQRVRQVDAGQDIYTIAGLGSSAGGSLTLVAPATVGYGGGQATATFAGSAASGSVAFFDSASGAAQSLGSSSFSGNVATLSLGALAAGSHLLSAVYAGDASHRPVQSAVVTVTVAAAAATASPDGVSTIYGAAIPALTGSLSGILPQDAQSVSLVLSTTANANSPPGSYPVQASLRGSAAGNYLLTTTPAAVLVAKAPVAVALSAALAVHVGSPSSAVPAGQVALLDGATVVQTAVLNATGDAAFSLSSLSNGTHTLTASYAGNVDFLAAASAPLLLSTGPGTTPDFTLASSGLAAVTVPAGNAAAFSFAASPTGGSLNSPIQLAASGLPPGATASFNPAYLPPSASASSFTLTIQTVKTSAANLGSGWGSTGLVFTLALPMLWFARRRRALLSAVCVALVSSVALLVSGCGARTNSSAATVSARVYTVTVTGTATADSGATLQHATTVTLTVQ